MCIYAGIKLVFPNQLATRCAFIDDARAGHLYNPVNDQTLPLPDFPAGVEQIIWDSADSGVFVACGGGSFSTYVILTYGCV
eukprot:COSAG05_NODE_1541_length_4597_cov_4.845709_5_plen_81_part_00